MVTNETKAFAQKLWDYHQMNHTLEKCDCILVLGSHDLRVAERGAELYLEGWAPLIILSGGLGRLTNGVWTETEADKFADIILKKGVRPDAILLENKSTNKGENIEFTKQLLKEKNLDPKSFLLVQKPYMERRSFATFKKNWPNKKLVVTSPQIPFEKYSTNDIPLKKVINIMVGDLQRIKLYADKGFQVSQEIPPAIWQAYEALVELGFNKQLVKN